MFNCLSKYDTIQQFLVNVLRLFQQRVEITCLECVRSTLLKIRMDRKERQKIVMLQYEPHR